MSSAQPSQDGKVNSTQDEDEEKLKDGNMLDSAGDDSAPTPTGQAGTWRNKRRFRLNSQQTRFLMVEFAKQPQPDAAHCERLSREIPGFSQRQVKVWFQNRRAKFSQLDPADRDCMITMRAAPKGFDNVQALHAVERAVDGIDVSTSSPETSTMQSCAEHMLMPLIHDTQRYKISERASLMAVSSGVGGMRYSPVGSMTSSNLELPSSPDPSNQRTYDFLPESQELTAYLDNTTDSEIPSSYIDPALFDPTSSSS
ncbi:hypothetical protein AU210_016372 [Fusarium oxysporum f. sp. radicis-cucumerinum]|uniref:Homeobox domain-containing protein n=1 Tax=Fusarium oxysporum f. sp. radicis-cucumerinum TaxID=327505 RepID=A0A2H3FP47_FUSOX|nr:hypothetical protein AU210_016372 [Fusarium oxysporum f. sp. radicis-cucumerinum]